MPSACDRGTTTRDRKAADAESDDDDDDDDEEEEEEEEEEGDEDNDDDELVAEVVAVDAEAAADRGRRMGPGGPSSRRDVATSCSGMTMEDRSQAKATFHPAGTILSSVQAYHSPS